MTTPTAPGLHDWARGMHTVTAAVELLTRTFGGRFARTRMPWIQYDEQRDRHWVDPDILRDNLGALSGGERRVLSVVAALIDGTAIDISDVVSGVDRGHLDLILAALSHAAGTHEHSTLVSNGDGTATVVRLSALHPWPERT